MDQNELGRHDDDDYLRTMKTMIENASVEYMDIKKTVKILNAFMTAYERSSMYSKTIVSKILSDSNKEGSVILPYDVIQVIDLIMLNTANGIGITHGPAVSPSNRLIEISNEYDLQRTIIEINGSGVGRLLRENLLIVVIPDTLVGQFWLRNNNDDNIPLGNNNNIPLETICYGINNNIADRVPSLFRGLMVCDAIIFMESNNTKSILNPNHPIIQAIYPDGTIINLELFLNKKSIFVTCGIQLLYDTGLVNITSYAMCSWVTQVPLTMSGYQRRVCEMLVRFGMFKNTCDAFHHIARSLDYKLCASFSSTEDVISFVSEILEDVSPPNQTHTRCITAAEEEKLKKKQIDDYCLKHFTMNLDLPNNHTIMFQRTDGKESRWTLTDKYSMELMETIRTVFDIRHPNAFICSTCAKMFLKHNHKCRDNLPILGMPL